MKHKLIVPTVLIIMLFFVSFANAAIYVDGQIYSGSTINITANSQYDTIRLTENSIANIYYQDEIVNMGGIGVYQPAVQISLTAENNAIVNFIRPKEDQFSFYLWDDGGNLSANFLTVYNGLQLNSLNYPSFASYSGLYRTYDSDVPQVLTPYIGEIRLRDNSVMNFVPEPISLILFGIGFFISRKSVHGKL